MDEMFDMYKKEAYKSLKSLKSCLSKLEKDPSDKKALKELARFSHMLKGNSLQMSYYSVAYLGKLMEDFTDKIIDENLKLDKDKLAFLVDFSNSLEQALIYETKNKKYKVSPKLFEKLDKYMKKDY